MEYLVSPLSVYTYYWKKIPIILRFGLLLALYYFYYQFHWAGWNFYSTQFKCARMLFEIIIKMIRKSIQIYHITLKTKRYHHNHQKIQMWWLNIGNCFSCSHPTNGLSTFKIHKGTCTIAHKCVCTLYGGNSRCRYIHNLKWMNTRCAISRVLSDELWPFRDLLTPTISTIAALYLSPSLSLTFALFLHSHFHFFFFCCRPARAATVCRNFEI